ncbi:hypothetical protein BVRB_5g119620 [Beta vulgaris subsp. vulgaris]|nr:hypothetical protein BVRB_5g119620 [Beta vulgaris subsp. vulgaris]
MVFFKGKICLVLLLFSLLVLCASFSVAKEDPELRQCKHQCRHQRQFDSKQKLGCERSCEEYIEEKERREMEEMRTAPRRDPEKAYRECRERCQEVEEGRREQQVCESECEQRRERIRRDDEIVGRRSVEEEEEEEEEVGGKSGKPYVFEDHHFSTKFKSKEGRVKVLKKFNKRSKLFKGIQNYRVIIFEANPQTFVVPNHWDADSVFFVAQGEGTVSLVYTDRRDSFNIKRGHVMVIPAGVTAYLINRGNNDKLVLVKLINPVSNPGKFESFFGPGGENPESFFNAFSTDILGAAFKTSGDKVKRIFSQQHEGAIIRASEEQIRALTHEKSGHWPFGGKGSKESGPFNLLKQSPRESNEFGTLFEVDSNDYRQLRDLNIALSFANITQGSMHTPLYNSRATKIAVVLNGRGYFEMACPHVSKSGHQQHRHRQHGGKSSRGEEETTPIHYEKIFSELRQGMVFVVPPGHPFVTLASENENLELICFEINAENNHKFPLAGQRNIMKNFEREAKELAFASSAEVVDQVFENQEEDFFFKGPRQQERHRGYSII